MKGLTFVGVGVYEEDAWPPGHPRSGECTQHMNVSGDYTRSAQPTNRDGTVNFNDPLAGGGPSNLGVTNLGVAGAPTSNSWTYTGDYSIPDWGDDALIYHCVTVTAVGGPAPPGPGASTGLGLSFTKAGFFFVDGQVTSHTESTGVTYHGGALTWHVEVTPNGLWYCEAAAGAARCFTACGEHWGGGELLGATFGMGALGGGGVDATLLLFGCSGAEATRTGPAECPHAPPGGGGPRAQVFWVP